MFSFVKKSLKVNGIVLIIVFLFLPSIVKRQAVTYYVDGDVDASGNGSSWAQAFKTIGEGEDAATQPGDIVEISGGIYTESIFVNVHSGNETAYVTFRGSDDSGHNNEVIIDVEGLGSHGLYVNQDCIRVENLTIRGADSTKKGAYISDADNVVFSRVKFINNARHILFDGKSTNMMVASLEPGKKILSGHLPNIFLLSWRTRYFTIKPNNYQS